LFLINLYFRDKQCALLNCHFDYVSESLLFLLFFPFLIGGNEFDLPTPNTTHNVPAFIIMAYYSSEMQKKKVVCDHLSMVSLNIYPGLLNIL